MLRITVNMAKTLLKEIRKYVLIHRKKHNLKLKPKVILDWNNAEELGEYTIVYDTHGFPLDFYQEISATPLSIELIANILRVPIVPADPILEWEYTNFLEKANNRIEPTYFVQ